MMLNQIIYTFDNISLKQLKNIAYSNRVDTKFIYNKKNLNKILKDSSLYYKVLEISGKRVFNYHTQYYDTINNDMYIAHHNNKSNRYKIRIRKYLFSNETYLEVKKKTNKLRTEKIRKVIDKEVLTNTKEEREFVEKNTPYKINDLKKTSLNTFSRITLVNKKNNEKVTIDFNLNFKYKNKQINLPFLVVVEVKRENKTNSDFIKILKQNKIYKQSFSKYCIGTLLLNKEIKYNNFKKKLLILRKIAKEDDRYNTNKIF